MNQRHIAWVAREPDESNVVIPTNNFEKDPKTCSHSYAFDEPPQCALCGSWICGMCRVPLRHPTSLCASCADEAVKS